MLSLILKPLLKNSDSRVEIPIDTEISLSMIDSGCIFVSLNELTSLIVKCSREEISSLKNINRITINFELIERPEFPSLRTHIEINTATNKSFNFDYFFNTESPTELELLDKLGEQNYFDIHFYDTQVVHSKKVELAEKDKSELCSLIAKVRS